MFALVLLLTTTPAQIVLHCRPEGKEVLAPGEFTLVESEGKVRYPVATGIAEVGATFSGDEVSFPDNWPKSFKGGYVINRRSLTYRRLVTYDGKTVVDEKGNCGIFSLPPDVSEGTRGERPPQN